MFNLFKPKEKARSGGSIEYFGLGEWWHDVLSEQDRNVIRQAFKPMGFSGSGLDDTVITTSSGDALFFLTSLIGWVNKEPTRFTAYKIADKMNSMPSVNMPVLSQHFAEQAKCRLFYKWRDTDDFALDRAIEACEASIALSKLAAYEFMKDKRFTGPPGHYCFKQYSIIEEKRGNIPKAISLVKRAKADRWQGDWDARLKRLEAKAKKK